MEYVTVESKEYAYLCQVGHKWSFMTYGNRVIGIGIGLCTTNNMPVYHDLGVSLLLVYIFGADMHILGVHCFGVLHS